MLHLVFKVSSTCSYRYICRYIFIWHFICLPSFHTPASDVNTPWLKFSLYQQSCVVTCHWQRQVAISSNRMTSLPLMQSIIIIDHSIHHIKSCQFHHYCLVRNCRSGCNPVILNSTQDTCHLVVIVLMLHQKENLKCSRRTF